jgi:hypothetical protein
MEVWQIVLYGMAALLALKSLTALMTAHRENLVRQLAEKEDEERREEQARAKAARAEEKKSRRPSVA